MSGDSVEMRQGELIRRGAYPEMTWQAIIVGWVLGALIAVSISYAALKFGFSPMPFKKYRKKGDSISF